MKKSFVFLTVLAITSMLFTGCASTGTHSLTPESAPMPGQTIPSTGTLTVLVTDAPSYEVESVTVHFSEVWVHKAADESGGNGGWIQLDLYDPDDQTFDTTQTITLSPEMGHVILAQSQLPAGKYTQIRVYMMEVEEEIQGEEQGTWVTYIPDPEDRENTHTIPAKLPSGTLKFVRPFEVLPATDGGEGEGAGTDIELDFNLQNSVVFTGATQSEDPKVIVKPVVKLTVTMGGGECELDGELTLVTLENKDPDSWAIIDDDIFGELRYSTEGEVFCYEFEGFGLDLLDPEKNPDGNWSLIYYADYEDRFNEWGGDNPGALIASGDASGGYLKLEGSVNLREDLTELLGMDLPHPDDANGYIINHDYSGDPDYYPNATGAKIWLVPSVYYDAGIFEVTDWVPASFLFETDLITFDDTDWEPPAP